MKVSRIIDTSERAGKAIHSLSCGHAVTETLSAYRGYYGRYRIFRREIKCPQCVGYRNK